MKKQTVKLLTAVICLIMFCQAETNGQAFSTSLKNTIDNADLIVKGEVIYQEAFKLTENGNIYTSNSFNVTRGIQGVIGSEIKIRTRGGSFEGRTDIVHHQPQFAIGEECILFLKQTRNSDMYELVNGKFGKMQLVKNAAFEAISEGSLEKFQSERQLLEQIGELINADLTISAIETEADLLNVSEIGELCFKIANPEPIFGTSQVAFDILIKSDVEGLLFSGGEVVLKYPISHLGSYIVQNNGIETNKEVVIENPDYSLSVEDLLEDKVKIKIETDCKKEEVFYPLSTNYEKLVRVIVSVQEWGNLGTLAIDDFSYEGNAQYFIEERGCIDFEKFCTEGQVYFTACTVNSVEVAPFGAGIGQILTINGEDFGNGIGAEITIPNPDDGGATNFSISGIDFNYIESWADDEIKLVVSSIGPNADNSPFASGIWEIDPDITSQEPNTLVCFFEVEIDYALLNENDLGKDKMIGLVFNPNNSPDGTFQWYLDMDIDNDPILQMKGISFAMVEEVAQQAFCDWEVATGIDFEYMGGIANGQNAADNMSVVQFSPITSAGLTAVRFTDNELCPDDEIFEERFREADIELNTNEDWFVSLNENIGAGKLDLYSVLIHEIGHSILLGHAMDTDNSNGTEDDRIMYWQVQTQQIKRDIDDKTTSGAELLVERSQEAIAPTRCFNGFVLATNAGACTTPTHEVLRTHCNVSLLGNVKNGEVPLKLSVENKVDFVQIVGVNGQVYYNKDELNEGDHEIPTLNFHSGLYFLVVSCEGHTFTQKFIIQ